MRAPGVVAAEQRERHALAAGEVEEPHDDLLPVAADPHARPSEPQLPAASGPTARRVALCGSQAPRRRARCASPSRDHPTEPGRLKERSHVEHAARRRGGRSQQLLGLLRGPRSGR